MILYVTKFKEHGKWTVLVVSLEDGKPKMSICRVATREAAIVIVAVFRHRQKLKIA
jgi:hypothetical protein